MVIKMKAFEAGAILFTIIVVVAILAIGQIAYGNVYGPLFNDSKKPKFEFCAPVDAFNKDGHTYISLNITDVNGPDAYPASITEIIIENSTMKLTLNTTGIASSVVNLTKAQYDLDKAVGYNDYSGLYLCLGTDAVFLLKLPVMLSPGHYTIYLLTPALPMKEAAKSTFTIS
jgi:thiosulfate dehydrogenase [quinone] small subunit